jgi:hypothetical protein
MSSCPRTTLAVLVLACMILVAQCARIGDSGKGWRVVQSDSADGLTCAYDGGGYCLDRRALARPDSLTRAPRFARSPEFRLRAVGSRCGGKRYLSSRRTCKSTRGYNFNVDLRATKSVWSIQPKAGAYSIVDANAKGCPFRYLALGPDTDDQSGMDYEEHEIELVTSRYDGPWVLISTDVRSRALTLIRATRHALRATHFARSPDITASGTLSPRATSTDRARNTVLKTSSCSRATGIPTSITR